MAMVYSQLCNPPSRLECDVIGNRQKKFQPSNEKEQRRGGLSHNITRVTDTMQLEKDLLMNTCRQESNLPSAESSPPPSRQRESLSKTNNKLFLSSYFFLFMCVFLFPPSITQSCLIPFKVNKLASHNSKKKRSSTRLYTIYSISLHAIYNWILQAIRQCEFFS
jgi:hypothetical protein